MTLHTLIIDSRDREYETFPTPSEYRIMLPKKYKNVKNARVVSAELPASFYVFTTDIGNTSFDIVLDGDPLPKTITIPDGNYTTSNIPSVLEDALEDATGLIWTVTISETTLRLTMSDTLGTEFSITTPAMTNQPTDWGLLYYIGFDRNTVYASTSGSLTSPRLASPNPMSYLLLDIEELNGIDEGGTYGTQVGRGSFAKFPIDANSFEYAFIDTSKCQFNDVVQNPPLACLDRLRIKFRFHDGRLIDFQGIEHSFTIVLETEDHIGIYPQNTGPALTNAASSAAASAAAAAVTATMEHQRRLHQKEVMEKKKRTTISKVGASRKKIYIGIAVFIVLALFLWSMFFKPRAPLPVPLNPPAPMPWRSTLPR